MEFVPEQYSNKNECFRCDTLQFRSTAGFCAPSTDFHSLLAEMCNFAIEDYAHMRITVSTCTGVICCYSFATNSPRTTEAEALKIEILLSPVNYFRQMATGASISNDTSPLLHRGREKRHRCTFLHVLLVSCALAGRCSILLLTPCMRNTNFSTSNGHHNNNKIGIDTTLQTTNCRAHTHIAQTCQNAVFC